MNDYMDEPKRSGTVLKVVLIIITVIAVVAAVAMGLLFYNAKSNIDSYRERNDALSQSYKEAQAKIDQFDTERAAYEQQIADLTQQLQDAQEQLDLMVPAVNDPDNPDSSEGGSSLNIRSGPGTTYKQLASVNQNSTVTAYAEQDDWLLVSYKDNAYGWVKASFVTKK